MINHTENIHVSEHLVVLLVQIPDSCKMEIKYMELNFMYKLSQT